MALLANTNMVMLKNAMRIESEQNRAVYCTAYEMFVEEGVDMEYTPDLFMNSIRAKYMNALHEDIIHNMAVKELMEKFGEEFFDSDEFMKFFDFESYEKEVAKSYWLIDLRVSPMTIMTYAVKKCW